MLASTVEEEMSNEDYDGEDEEEEEDEEYVSWIVWFCELKGNEFFCVVDREFIEDEFNLTGLSSMVTFYHYALDIILDLESHDSDRLTEEQKRLVEISAETLYGLIHARFITTSRGLKLMEKKFSNNEFGTCPRVFCGNQAVLPVGQSDVVRESSVKLYCPKCEDIYYPSSSRHKILDGAFWGTTFAHLLLMQMRDSGVLTISRPLQRYIPKIYGFSIHKSESANTLPNTNTTSTATAIAATNIVNATTASHINCTPGSSANGVSNRTMIDSKSNIIQTIKD